MAKKKRGYMRVIIKSIDALLPIAARVKMYVGTPIAAAAPKHKSCRFVRLNATFVLTLLKSLGIFT
jgi:hypothetical protein